MIKVAPESQICKGRVDRDVDELSRLHLSRQLLPPTTYLLAFPAWMTWPDRANERYAVESHNQCGETCRLRNVDDPIRWKSGENEQSFQNDKTTATIRLPQRKALQTIHLPPSSAHRSIRMLLRPNTPRRMLAIRHIALVELARSEIFPLSLLLFQMRFGRRFFRRLATALDLVHDVARQRIGIESALSIRLLCELESLLLQGCQPITSQGVKGSVNSSLRRSGLTSSLVLVDISPASRPPLSQDAFAAHSFSGR